MSQIINMDFLHELTVTLLYNDGFQWASQNQHMNLTEFRLIIFILYGKTNKCILHMSKQFSAIIYR